MEAPGLPRRRPSLPVQLGLKHVKGPRPPPRVPRAHRWRGLLRLSAANPPPATHPLRRPSLRDHRRKALTLPHPAPGDRARALACRGCRAGRPAGRLSLSRSVRQAPSTRQSLRVPPSVPPSPSTTIHPPPHSPLPLPGSRRLSMIVRPSPTPCAPRPLSRQHGFRAGSAAFESPAAHNGFWGRTGSGRAARGGEGSQRAVIAASAIVASRRCDSRSLSYCHCVSPFRIAKPLLDFVS